ncbi:MAG: hypothetical protein O7B79_08160 [SAR324 cluster bacterium]|nr:hypothetical protein [SAR324 cluster bacterium]
MGGGKALAGALVLLLLALLPVVSQGVERRRSQYLKEQAYLVVPFPFNIPGIGSGIAVTGLAANIGGGNTDAFGIIITGDASGTIVRVSDFHLIEEKLILSVTYQRISRAVINNYETRGMDSDPNAFNLLELSQADGQEIELCLCLFEKKLQFFLGMEFDESTIERVRNSNGEIIGDFDQPIRGRETTRRIGVIIDNSDDLSDPRKGIRLEFQARRSPPRDGDDPDFIVLDLSLGFYIPMGKISTLVLNYFQSDARVSRQGQTDPTALRNELGLNCTTPECNAAVDALVERRIAENRFGTATSLGGAFSRLRSYPVGRFQGAHMVFYGAEFRWNLTDEATPFDYFIWKDVRSSLQLAFFAETGSVAESRSGLEKFKSSYGLGIRLISASGFVYRADLATGDEGTETVIIFGYPF